jgi:hypothetical protein
MVAPGASATWAISATEAPPPLRTDPLWAMLGDVSEQFWFTYGYRPGPYGLRTVARQALH